MEICTNCLNTRVEFGVYENRPCSFCCARQHEEVAVEDMNGLARNAKGHWVATHMGQRVTFTEQRFGEAAELLARRALLAMQSGAYNELKDNALLKQSYSRELAAKMLGIHVGELNEWLLSGVLRGQEITPPRPDSRRGAGKISGYELAIAQKRMKDDGVN